MGLQLLFILRRGAAGEPSSAEAEAGALAGELLREACLEPRLGLCPAVESDLVRAPRWSKKGQALYPLRRDMGSRAARGGHTMHHCANGMDPSFAVVMCISHGLAVV